MNYQELKDEVKCLGFENEIGDEESFLFAANRALRQIFAERHVAKEKRFTYTPRAHTAPVSLHLSAGESVTVSLCGGGCSFSLSGVGSYTLTNGNLVSTVNFADTVSAPVRFLLNQTGSITFTARDDCNVGNLRQFSGTFSSALDIPTPDGLACFNLSVLCPDFLFLASDIRLGGKILDGAVIAGGLLTFPDDESGDIRFSYYRTPSLLTSESVVVDIDPSLCHLLPLLVGAYLWLDDDPSRSDYYMRLYREGITRLAVSVDSAPMARYDDCLGWV